MNKTSAILQSLGFGYGQTELEFPNNAKPFSLAVTFMETSKSLRRPTNWQDFETLCKKLWGEIWNCPEIKKNGRSGQNQNGVDVYGIPQNENEYYGIQCKGKDEYTDKQFSEKEINSEIKKAKTFTPKLKKFYLVTTAIKDTKIEAFVRQLNIEHIQKKIFEVHLFSWEDIVDLIDENRITHDWYVKSQNYKTNKKAILTFQNNEDEINATVKFVKNITEYKQKITLANSYFNQLVFPTLHNITAVNSPLFDNSINNSYFEFYFNLHNIGDDPIEDFTIFFELDGEYQDLVRVRNWSGLFAPKNPIPYDTFLNDDKKGGKIIPNKNILVSEDNIAFDDLRIKPLHKTSTVQINWRLTSKDYKNAGTLKINFNIEIIRQSKTILVEDPLEVRTIVGEIEDYITKP